MVTVRRGPPSDIEMSLTGLGRIVLMVQRQGRLVIQVPTPGGDPLWITSEGMYVPLTDTRETIWGFVDSAGRVCTRFAYSAYGSPLAASGFLADSIGYHFVGHPYDRDLELYAFGERLYDPHLRRFLDPAGMGTQTSPYAFRDNAPIRSEPRINAVIGMQETGGMLRPCDVFAATHRALASQPSDGEGTRPTVWLDRCPGGGKAVQWLDWPL